MFARRTDWNAIPNLLTRRLVRLRAAGREILDLTETNPTACGFDYPAETILSAVSRPEILTYVPSPRGDLRAREAIASIYRDRGATMDPDRLFMTSTTSEGYAFLFRLLAGPGDEVLAPAPSYPLFDLLARLNDVELIQYPIHPNLDFSIDLDSLSRAIGDRTRAVLLVNPGNPGGAYLKRAEFEVLAEICAARGVAIICDEVFLDYGFRPDPERAGTLAGRSDALIFVLDGISKMLVLPQMKVAWIAVSGPGEAAQEACRRLEILADTYLSPGAPAQVALPDLLSLKPALQEQVKNRLVANRAFLDRTAGAGSLCRCLPAEGGWSAVMRIPRTLGEEEWTGRLLEEDGVLVHPGYYFDFPEDGWLVLSLLPCERTFQDGVDRLVARINGRTGP